MAEEKPEAETEVIGEMPAYYGMTGKELFEAIRKDYVQTYAYRICEFLARIDPDTFKKEFGSIENCVKDVVDDAEVWFAKWLPHYVQGVIARVRGPPTGKKV